MEELHTHLSHVAPSMIRDMLTKGMVEGVKLDPMHSTMGQCKSCEYGKAIRNPIGTVHEPKRCERFGDEVHTDLWGPSDIQTPGHKKFYMSFTNDYTRYTHLYLLAAKSNTFNAYKMYVAWAKMQRGTVIKRLRSDRGGEYLSEEFSWYLKLEGTERKLTTHDMPQHNSIAERLNRTLVERVCMVLHASGLPKTLWGEALAHVIWVKNHTASHILDGKMPHKLLTGMKPKLNNLPVWGTRVWVHDDLGPKLDARAKEGYWVGFDADSNAHWIYDCTLSVECNISFERRDSANSGSGRSQIEGEKGKKSANDQRHTHNKTEVKKNSPLAPNQPEPQTQVPGPALEKTNAATKSAPPEPTDKPHRSTCQQTESRISVCCVNMRARMTVEMVAVQSCLEEFALWLLRAVVGARGRTWPQKLMWQAVSGDPSMVTLISPM